jgi:O-acetyl-ADP-ribose deacetylase (regulator of RNase III)
MTPITYLTGDATKPTIPGNKIICHVCNDIGKWGKGFVLALSKRWPEPQAAYLHWYKNRKTNDFALGAVQLVQVVQAGQAEPEIWVANLIGQHKITTKATPLGTPPPIRYEAIETGLKTLASVALQHKATVHMPRIGAGLAGGTWDRIEPLIESSLSAQNVAVYIYDLPQ